MKQFIVANRFRLAALSVMFICVVFIFILSIKNNPAKAGKIGGQTTASPPNVWIMLRRNIVNEINWDKIVKGYESKDGCSNMSD